MVAARNALVESQGAPLFIPKLSEFLATAPKNFPELMAASPHGRVNFSVRIRGRLIEVGGYIDEVKIKPGSEDAAEWSLLCCPDVDLSQLI